MILGNKTRQKFHVILSEWNERENPLTNFGSMDPHGRQRLPQDDTTLCVVYPPSCYANSPMGGEPAAAIKIPRPGARNSRPTVRHK